MRPIAEISKTNPEKPLTLTIDGREYYRCPIHTRLVKVGDNLSQLVEEYVLPYFQEGDCVYISEKIVSLCQKGHHPQGGCEAVLDSEIPLQIRQHQRFRRRRRPQRIQDAGGHSTLRQAQGDLHRPGRRGGTALWQAGRVL